MTGLGLGMTFLNEEPEVVLFPVIQTWSGVVTTQSTQPCCRCAYSWILEGRERDEDV